MVVMPAFAAFLGFNHTVNGQVNSEDQEQHRADMPEPFFERTQLARQVSDADRAVTYQPRYQHDRQSCTETEYHRHHPVPTAGQSQRDIDHRQEIDETVRTESDRKEDTEDEGP